MPIEFSTGGPGAILETMIEQKWGDALLRIPRNTARTIEEAKAGFEAGDTFRIFYPTLQDIIGGVLVDDRTAQGWRCLLFHRTKCLPSSRPNGTADRSPSILARRRTASCRP